MEQELLQQLRGEAEAVEVAETEAEFATLEDVRRLLSVIPRGPKGEDAQITAELIQEILNVATPIKDVDYRDGVDGTDGTNGKDAPVLTGKDLADMLNALAEAKKLDFSSIKGLNKMDDKVAVLEAARKRNSADHEFYDEKINEILEWIDRIKGLKLIQAGSNRISGTNIDWSTVNWGDFFGDFYTNINWGDFFTNVDWTQNNWADFFTAVDWSTLTNWTTFVDSLTTNWTTANWDLFIDTFITNVDNDDVFNFLNQMSGLNKGDMLVYNSVAATWEILPAGTDGFVITANSALDAGIEYQAPSGGSPLAVQEEGVTVDANTVTLNFTGSGATATQTSPGVVQVDIPGGGGGTAEAVVETVTQTGHGLVEGKWVYISATNTYGYGLATSSATADSVGVITNVVDPNTFEVTTEGFASGAWVPAYGAGNAAHLSTTVAGDTQQFAPTTIGQIDKPVGIIVEDGVKMYVHNYRGRQITAAGIGTGGGISGVVTAGSPFDALSVPSGGQPAAAFLGNGLIDNSHDITSSGASIGIGDVAATTRVAVQIVTSILPFMLNEVRPQFDKVGSPTDLIKVTIEDDAAGDPSGVALATGFFDSTGAVASFVYEEIALDKMISLENSSPKWVVYERQGAIDPANYLKILTSSSSGTGGIHKEYNGATWVTNTNQPGTWMARRIYEVGKVYVSAASSSGVASTNTNDVHFDGFVSGNPEAESIAPMQVTGVTAATFTGLAIGTDLYGGSDGDVTAVLNAAPIGKGLSTTEVLIDKSI